MGRFPVDRINPSGGSIALGHPFGATGARILSHGVKELTAMSVGARSVVSVCADGGEGTVALLQRIWRLGTKGATASHSGGQCKLETHWMFPLPSRERCRSPLPSASVFEPSR